MFFDEGVPVANRVGDEGKGWTYGKYLVEFERGSGIASAKLREGLRAITELAEIVTWTRDRQPGYCFPHFFHCGSSVQMAPILERRRLSRATRTSPGSRRQSSPVAMTRIAK